MTAVDAAAGVPDRPLHGEDRVARAQRLLVIAGPDAALGVLPGEAHAWRGMFSADGPIEWVLHPVRPGNTPGYGMVATTVTLAYLWLPYMILPVYAALGRVPDSLFRGLRRPRGRIGPHAAAGRAPDGVPGFVAGSIFTFSLTMGDYIAVKIVGGTTQLLGNVVYDNQGAANNLPFAAAVATVPIVVMLGYLAAARRTGALESL